MFPHTQIKPTELIKTLSQLRVIVLVQFNPSEQKFGAISFPGIPSLTHVVYRSLKRIHMDRDQASSLMISQEW